MLYILISIVLSKGHTWSDEMISQCLVLPFMSWTTSSSFSKRLVYLLEIQTYSSSCSPRMEGSNLSPIPFFLNMAHVFHLLSKSYHFLRQRSSICSSPFSGHGSLTRVSSVGAGAQTLRSSPMAFSSREAGSWVRSGAAGTGPGAQRAAGAKA